MTVKSTILSFSPEHLWAFDNSDVTDPTNYGTALDGSFSKGSPSPVYYSSGGPDLQGSWEFSWDKNAEVYFRAFQAVPTSNNLLTQLNDKDWSWGVWFKINPTSPGSYDSSMTLARYGGWISSSSLNYDGNNKSIAVIGQNSGVVANDIDDGTWHYFAETVKDNGDGTGLVTRYVDGQEVLQFNATFGTTTAYIQFGDNFVSGTDVYQDNYELSNFYVATTSNIDATEILAIWNAAGGAPAQDVSIASTPATATVLITEPTIVVTVADHTEITTSIIVSAELASNISIFTSKFINITSHIAMTATAEHENNVVVSTGVDINFDTTFSEAFAEIIEPALTRPPMVANAISGNHIVSVDPSYLNLVKTKNPYIYIYDGKSASTTVNEGYGNNTITFGDITSNQDGGAPMNLVDEGISWFSDGTFATQHTIRFNAASQEDSFLPIQQTGNWAAEVWVKSAGYENATFIDTPAGIVHGRRGNSAPYGYDIQVWLRDSNDPSQATSTFKSTTKPLAQNAWNHIVFQQEEQTPGAYQYQLWVNGALLWTASPEGGPISFNDATGRRTYPISDFQDSEPYLGYAYSDPDYDVSYGGIYANYNMYVDQIAYYDRALSSAEIAYHYEYVILSNPNNLFYAFPMFGDINFLGGAFFVTANINNQQIALTGYADFVLPSVTPGVSKNILAEPIFVSSELLEPNILFDSEVSAEIMTAFAEPGIPIFLNNIYAQYIITNYSPYRYANFDSADVLQDLGSDADYSLPQIEYSGTVSEPGYGINNKSILTSGTYYTDGVKLLESEFDDTWGTGLDHYHSSFWMRRSILDQSTTGLRVLWNLNGAYDNQHVILYQYQGNLKIQFNNGSGTYIEDSVAMDLFDYDRHFIAINFDHTGSNIFVEVFVDGALAMSTDLGQYAGQTINGIVPIGPNDPAANKPRLGVGCLITPFVDTALPIIPANTRLYVDEIVWSKTHFELSDAIALYNTLPAQTIVVVAADSLIASGEIVNPGIIVGRSINVDAAFANAELLEPNIIVELNNEFAADVMTATAEINDANASQIVTINSDVMVASALLMETLVVDFVAAAPMTATIEILQNMGMIYDPGLTSGTLFTIYFNEFPDEYVEYLVKLNSFKSIPPFREVK